MSTAERGLELCEAIMGVDADVLATTDPRSATPPCVLVTPPRVTWDAMCSGTAQWQLVALAPGVANYDAWVVLDGLLAVVAKAVPVESHYFIGYSLAMGQPQLPAYLIQFTQGVDVP